jgi:hypothetical protein
MAEAAAQPLAGRGGCRRGGRQAGSCVDCPPSGNVAAERDAVNLARGAPMCSSSIPMATWCKASANAYENLQHASCLLANIRGTRDDRGGNSRG